MARDWRDDWITVSVHAGEQWHRRTNSPGIGPRGAWIDGEPYVGEEARRHVDEMRHHPPSGTILLRKGNTLVTVLPADEVLAEGAIISTGGER